jgi:Ni/Fe-hydrogenase subunit HybB-like protein
MKAMTRTSSFLPLFSVGLGVACLAAFWAGGDLESGFLSLAIMGGFGLVILVGGRSDLIRGLRGDGRDEYWERIDVHATAIAGLAVLTTVIVMCLWEWGHGRDGSPYAQLGAIGGVAYVLGIVGLRLRS